jgi:hypothetical protein
MKRFSTLILFLIASCGTFKEARHDAYLNKRYHIDVTKPIDYSTAPTKIKTPRLVTYFDSLDSASKKHFLDSLMDRIDSIEFFRTHRQI